MTHNQVWRFCVRTAVWTMTAFLVVGCRSLPDQSAQDLNAAQEQIQTKYTGKSGRPPETTTILSIAEALAYTDEASKRQALTPRILFSENGGSVAYIAERDGKYRVRRYALFTM